jgi:hypothetical protein
MRHKLHTKIHKNFSLLQHFMMICMTKLMHWYMFWVRGWKHRHILLRMSIIQKRLRHCHGNRGMFEDLHLGHPCRERERVFGLIFLMFCLF